MLEVRGLRVNYGTTVAVDGIDIDVADGELVALLGPNGAGKTSTLHALSRIIGSSGSITFDGADISKAAPQALARIGLIQVPEGRHVFPNLSVHENLQVGQTARQGRTGFTIDDVYSLFPALVPLRSRAGWALSGGEQQMVAIGRGLVAVPRLLLLDEPSLGLAPVIVNAVFQALAEVGRQVPMLLVEQSTKRALALCNRAYVLVTGQIVAQGPSSDFADREAMLAAYLGHRDTV
jgi:branched-chain amino acid transport system ATP-binding protein